MEPFVVLALHQCSSSSSCCCCCCCCSVVVDYVYDRCHWLMEPFVVSALRQLSSAHPVYKLLKPYFRSETVDFNRSRFQNAPVK